MRRAVIQNQWSVDLKDCYRQYQSNGAAFFAALGYFYLAVVLSGNLAYKGKTQTGTAHGAAAGFVHTVERIKDFLLIFREIPMPVSVTSGLQILQNEYLQ